MSDASSLHSPATVVCEGSTEKIVQTAYDGPRTNAHGQLAHPYEQGHPTRHTLQQVPDSKVEANGVAHTITIQFLGPMKDVVLRTTPDTITNEVYHAVSAKVRTRAQQTPRFTLVVMGDAQSPNSPTLPWNTLVQAGNYTHVMCVLRLQGGDHTPPSSPGTRGVCH